MAPPNELPLSRPSNHDDVSSGRDRDLRVHLNHRPGSGIDHRQRRRQWHREMVDRARLHGQGRREAAMAMLGPVYAAFNEVFELQDLKDARALLEQLAQ